MKFKVGDALLEGRVNIEITEKGKVFYDVTKIKRSNLASRQYQKNDNPTSLPDASLKNSIANNDKNSNTNSTDIRKSINERETLAKAFESVVSSEFEKEIVERYKNKINTLDAKEMELAGYKAELPYTIDFDERVKLTNRIKVIEGIIDRTDGELLKLEASRPLNEVLKRARYNAAEKQRQKVNERVDSGKYRERIRKNSADMIKWLEQPTDQKYIAENMRGAVAEFLSTIDFVSHRADDESETTLMWKNRMEALGRIISNEGGGSLSDIELEIDPDYLPTLSEFLEDNKDVMKISMMDSHQLEKLDYLVATLFESSVNL